MEQADISGWRLTSTCPRGTRQCVQKQQMCPCPAYRMPCTLVMLDLLSRHGAGAGFGIQLKRAESRVGARETEQRQSRGRAVCSQFRGCSHALANSPRGRSEAAAGASSHVGVHRHQAVPARMAAGASVKRAAQHSGAGHPAAKRAHAGLPHSAPKLPQTIYQPTCAVPARSARRTRWPARPASHTCRVQRNQAHHARLPAGIALRPQSPSAPLHPWRAHQPVSFCSAL